MRPACFSCGMTGRNVPGKSYCTDVMECVYRQDIRYRHSGNQVSLLARTAWRSVW